MADDTRSDDEAGGGERAARRRRRALLLVMAAAVTLAGCSSGGSGGGSSAPAATPSGAPAAAEAARETGLPLETAMLGDAESQAVTQNALNKIAAKCARDQGYQLTERPPVTAAQLLADRKAQGSGSNPYAQPSAQALKDFGYAGSEHGRDPKPPETGQPPAADAAGRNAETKCAKEAAIRHTAADPAMNAARGRIRELTTQADQQTTADSRLVAALAQWSGCMRPSGYTYASPTEAEQQFEKVVGAAGAQELAIARADAECRSSSRLADVWYQVRLQVEQRLVEQNAQVLKDAAEADKRAAQAASQAAGQAATG
ncbi:hypothetical protein ACFVUH_07435 [Kitasatospora sp. NPDC058032]|uniref:hypothetical protein n=1 Tax=Kitasatospora sp. NPDC058032 TaxID=3346307 RepID=UPI0036DDFEA7